MKEKYLLLILTIVILVESILIYFVVPTLAILLGLVWLFNLLLALELGLLEVIQKMRERLVVISIFFLLAIGLYVLPSVMPSVMKCPHDLVQSFSPDVIENESNVNINNTDGIVNIDTKQKDENVEKKEDYIKKEYFDSATYSYNVVNTISGILVPLFTFIALFVAWRTFREERTEHKNDQFTNDFFNMLQIQKTLRNEIKGSFSVRYTIKENATGVSYFSVAKKELKNIIDVLEDKNIESEDLKYNIKREYHLEDSVLKEYKEKKKQEEKIKISYGAFLGKHPELDSYFRHLYHILQRLNLEKVNCGESEVNRYSDMLQVMLTEDELYLLQYHCICFEETRNLVLYFKILDKDRDKELRKNFKNYGVAD
ncbi:MAG: putative phage abortive infection protein [Paludibacteraceae bacterium]|nr:putative phage abortive infection protein [Paludibacteraceae bacterium]